MPRAILALLLCLAAFRPAAAQETTLRAVSAFQEGTTFSRPFEGFIRRVNAEGRGLVRITFIGGPRAMPPFELGNAVRTGVVDLINSPAAFYDNLMPEGAALKLATRPWAELRANGGYALLNRLHEERVNAHYLARHGDGIPYQLFLNREIAGPDLRGLTIRTSPIYRAFFAALGANLVNTPPGEVYTALERGVVQGYGWPTVGIFDLGWQERSRFRVEPGFYRVEVNLLVNLPRWRGLRDDQRAFLDRMALALEADEAAASAELMTAELARQAAAGIRPLEFTGEVRARWIAAAQEAGWAELERIAPANLPELRRLLTAAP